VSRKRLIAGGVIALAVVIAAASIFTSPSSKIASADGSVGVISIEGTIMGGKKSFFGGVAASENVMSQIKAAAEDPTIKAVVLRINSPGGSVAATQEIAREIEKLKETGKPVVASMGDTAASGGYWIATTADRIYANSGTLTGSIGAIMTVQNLEELYKKVGMDFYVFKSGPYKDIGSSTRDMTGEEKAILQGMVDDVFGDFVDAVAKGRNLPRQEVEGLATGRVFTGQQALDAKLVDEIGNYYDAVEGAASLAGIKGKPAVKTFGTPGLFVPLLRNELGLRFGDNVSGTGIDDAPAAAGPMLLAVPFDL
jgi:protease-4